MRVRVFVAKYGAQEKTNPEIPFFLFLPICFSFRFYSAPPHRRGERRFGMKRTNGAGAGHVAASVTHPANLPTPEEKKKKKKQHTHAASGRDYGEPR